jgi:uncharacterized damage-inducible protein DinB
MKVAGLLAEEFGRIGPAAAVAVEGLPGELLTARPAPGANTLAWLLWHLARVQDDHVAEVAGREQVWVSGGWAKRFDLPFDDSAIGYGFTPEQVAQVRVDSAELLIGYLDAVLAATLDYVRGLSEADLDEVVDDAWDPPVTLGVRLVSVLSDDLQHVGQAAYVRGLLT